MQVDIESETDSLHPDEEIRPLRPPLRERCRRAIPSGRQLRLGLCTLTVVAIPILIIVVSVTEYHHIPAATAEWRAGLPDEGLFRAWQRCARAEGCDLCAVRRTLLEQPTAGRVELRAFPGSGAEWLRHLVQEGTRVWTASDVCLPDLQWSRDYEAECLPPFYYRHAALLARRTEGLAPWGEPSAVVVLWRDPFEAIVAEFKRVLACKAQVGFTSCLDKDIGPAYFQDSRWRDFARRAAQEWLRWNEWALQGRATHVSYDALLENAVEAAAPVLNATLRALGDPAPSLARATDCVARAPANPTHRKHWEGEAFDPYAAEDLRQELCAMWGDAYKAHGWGLCG